MPPTAGRAGAPPGTLWQHSPRARCERGPPSEGPSEAESRVERAVAKVWDA
jgi:hypothetical protein